MSALAGKVYLVTGAATGIGRATAEHLAGLGARVYGIGLDGDEGRRVHAGREPGLVFREVDLRDTVAIEAAMADLIAREGGLDGIVNCAGIYMTGKRAEDVTDAEWELTLSVNLTAIFKLCRAGLPHLRAAGGGAIVNIASVHAEATVPGVPAYAASKAGVVGFSRQLALDYASDRIRVNALLVGSVATRMTLDGLDAAGGAEAVGLSFAPTHVPRIADPREIATAIGFLLTPDASFITGAALAIDGGMLAKLM